MNRLLSDIDIIINGAISSYNSKISEKYNLNISELESIWNEVIGSGTQPKVPAPTPAPKPQATVKVVVPKVNPPPKPSSDAGGCPYSFTRGPNAGTICGTKVKGEGSYCSKHKQYEGKEQKQKKVLPQPKKSTHDNSSEDEEKVREEIKKKVFEGFSDEQVERMFIRKPDLGDGLSYHKQTNLVCDNDKFIVGKKDGSRVIPLTEDDIKLAKSWNFKLKAQPTSQEKSTIKDIISSAISSGENKAQENKPQEKIAVITQERKAQEKITVVTQESKAQESKAQEKKKPVLVSAKKFNIPVPQLNAKTIEKSKLPINEAPIVQKQTVNNKTSSLNEEAKNTKKSITNLIEQQKQQNDVEDILEELTNGNSDQEEDQCSELEEEEDIDIDGEYDEE